MNIEEQIISKIKESNSIAIAMHDSPDADCIGSAFAFKKALKNIGKDVDIILQNKIHESYSKIIGNENTNKTIFKNKMYDILFILDCSNIDRTVYNIEKYSGFIIVIDHHIESEPYGDIYLCKNESCTGIILYDIIKELTKIDKYISTCLYLTIVSDTNYFKNNNVNSKTHKVISELLDYGADIGLVKNRFKKPSLSLTRLIGNTLYDVKYDKEYKICYLLVNQNHIKQSNSTYEEASTLIEYIRDVEDCEIALLFLQKNNLLTIKARSKTKNVAIIMEQFNGGGHKHAAGTQIYSDNVYSTINRVLNTAKEYLY